MAENDVNRLIDMLYERVEDAKSPALKPNLSMVDRDEVLDLLDELRNQLPVELKRAQELLAAREKFVDEAKRDVERMMRQADLEAKRRFLIARCSMPPRRRPGRSSPTRRIAPASSVRWQMSTQRTLWPGRRRLYRPR